jgi:hypothetical protein|tara:strand:+ start:135 stop:1187 length:1053 start_codon:yes stop_codon:yes gene_type:complete
MLDKWFKKESPLLNMIGFGGGAANRLTGFKIPPIEATGGTTNTDGGFKYHIYTVDTPSPTLNLAVTFAPDDATIELLVIGGGGGAAWNNGGGGGAGGIAYAPALPVAAATYPVTVGTGGTGTNNYLMSGSPQLKGNNSTFTHPVGTITGLGGAGPYTIDSLTEVAGPGQPFHSKIAPGGSGAGTRRSGTRNPTYRPGIAAAQPTQPNFGAGVLHYGNNGGDVDQTQQYTGAGGGGAGGTGFDYNESVFQPSRGRGGAGQPFTGFPAPAVAPGIPSPNQPAFTPAVTPTGLYGGGGGGSSENKAPGGSTGGTGGGGGAGSPGVYGTGGGGGSADTTGLNGGAGLVVLRYPV